MTANGIRPARRLGRDVAILVTAVGAILVVAATVTTFWVTQRSLSREIIDRLAETVENRAARENEFFALATHHLTVFSDEFVRAYQSDVAFTDADFRALYFTDDDGATRLRPEYFDSHTTGDGELRHGMSSFIGSNQPVDNPDLQRRLIIAHQLVARFGPAWWDVVGGLHASYPENAITIFHPTLPWGLMADPNLTMNEYSTIASTLQEHNPARKPVWTGLYFDETIENWTTTFQIPVDLEGAHLVNPSFDIDLTTLLERLINNPPVGARNVVFTRDGFLVARPEPMTEPQQWRGILSFDDAEDPELARLHRLTEDAPLRPGLATLVDDESGSNWILATRLAGPEWVYAMVFPKRLVTARAIRLSTTVLVLGLAVFVGNTLLVLLVLNRKVSQPLAGAVDIVRCVEIGEYAEAERRAAAAVSAAPNEIGALAEALAAMCRTVTGYNRRLEQTVSERTRELSVANDRLRTLSLLDALTELHNRRSFEEDLARIIAEANRGIGEFSLVLLDVDYFKKYNDHYGHQAGDRVLQRIADTLRSCVRSDDRVYRYGGEELAVLLPRASRANRAALGTRFVDAVAGLAIEHAESPFGIVTISGGMAAYGGNLTDPQAILSRADELLYRSKAGGRNRMSADEAVERA